MKKNVLVIGSRGVGKTTLLSLFSNEIKSLLSDEGYEVTVDSSGEKKLNESLKDLSLMMETPYVINHHIESTGEIKQYNYMIKNKDTKKKLIDFSITDHPGGLFGEKIHRSKLPSIFQKSDIVIYAIDTPYLMEESGRYNQTRNQKNLFNELLKTNSDELKNKSILFALLKSEKYSSTLLEKSFALNYSDTIEMLKSENSSEPMILPIETVGGIIFEKFSMNVRGELPEPIFMRRHPNSEIILREVDTFSRWVLTRLLNDIKNKKIIFFKTSKAKCAGLLINNFERMI